MGKLVLLLFLFSVSVVWSDEILPAQDENQPIEITARQLEAFQSERKSVFTGDVIAKQGDMTLFAETLTVFFQQEQNQVERMEALGGVRVVQLDRVATAEKAIFQQADETLTLIGQAEVRQGQNQIAGEEIILYLKESRSLIKSSEKGRVKAVIVPEKKQEQQ